MKIAIVGKMCSGKTSVANYIQSIRPEYKLFSFAMGVKDVAYTYFQMPRNPEMKNRSLLISIGSKMREIDPDVWVKYTHSLTKQYDFCIIDDVRFSNELDTLVNDNWKLIKLNVSRDTQIERLKKLYPHTFKDHIYNIDNETELHLQYYTNYDLIINTDSSRDEIERKIDHFLSSND
jgi:hypothetical protein